MRVSKANAVLKSLNPQNHQDTPYPPSAPAFLRSRSEYNDETGEMLSWQRLRTTFSNKNPLQAPYMNFPECVAGIPEKAEPSLYSENTASLRCPLKRMSSTAVQVNIDHCTDCRRHIKYGKPLRDESNDSNCESESSQAESVLPISVNKRKLRPFTDKRNSEICHEEDCNQLEGAYHNDDKKEIAECINKCEHKTVRNDDGQNSGWDSTMKQAFTESKVENSPQPESKGKLHSVFKWLVGRESPLANTKLVLQLLMLLSLVLFIVHSILTTPATEEVPTEATYLQICLNYFIYLFSTTEVPVSFFVSLF